MSLAIDVDRVERVLLADGWHDVAAKSFTMDSYEFIWHGEGGAESGRDVQVLHGGGQSGVCATGFAFADAESLLQIEGPLTAILAVASRI